MLEQTSPQVPSTKLQFDKIFYIVLGILILIIGYYTYDWYQTKQYIEKTMPLLRTYEVLNQDSNHLITQSGGKRFIDLFDDCKRIKQTVKDMKLKLAEINPTTTKSQEIAQKFQATLDLHVDIMDAFSRILQAQMNLQSSEKFLKEFESNPIMNQYSGNLIAQKKQELETAKKDMADAQTKYKELGEKYQQVKKELYSLLGMALPKQDAKN